MGVLGLDLTHFGPLGVPEPGFGPFLPYFGGSCLDLGNFCPILGVLLFYFDPFQEFWAWIWPILGLFWGFWAWIWAISVLFRGFWIWLWAISFLFREFWAWIWAISGPFRQFWAWVWPMLSLFGDSGPGFGPFWALWKVLDLDLVHVEPYEGAGPAISVLFWPIWAFSGVLVLDLYSVRGNQEAGRMVIWEQGAQKLGKGSREQQEIWKRSKRNYQGARGKIKKEAGSKER